MEVAANFVSSHQTAVAVCQDTALGMQTNKCDNWQGGEVVGLRGVEEADPLEGQEQAPRVQAHWASMALSKELAPCECERPRLLADKEALPHRARAIQVHQLLAWVTCPQEREVVHGFKITVIVKRCAQLWELGFEGGDGCGTDGVEAARELLAGELAEVDGLASVCKGDLHWREVLRGVAKGCGRALMEEQHTNTTKTAANQRCSCAKARGGYELRRQLLALSSGGEAALSC
jgi:hypothetical protein